VKAINFIADCIFVASSRGRGKGVFTREALPPKTTIEIAPVIVMPGEQRALLDKTLLHDYIFEWGDGGRDCCMALGYVPIYNHAAPSNCEYEMHFNRQLITVKTVRAIEAGEELFINYNGDWDNGKGVWFALK